MTCRTARQGAAGVGCRAPVLPAAGFERPLPCRVLRLASRAGAAGATRRRTRACRAVGLPSAPRVVAAAPAGSEGAAYPRRALWTCPAYGRPVRNGLHPQIGDTGAHSPLEISRATAGDRAGAEAARFPQFHSASLWIYSHGKPRHDLNPKASICPQNRGNLRRRTRGHDSQPEYTLMKPSNCPNNRDHLSRQRCRMFKKRRLLLPRPVRALPAPPRALRRRCWRPRGCSLPPLL